MTTTHAPQMTAPPILGRSTNEKPSHADQRAETKKVGEVMIPYTSGAVGVAKAELFCSKDDEDRGGVVLRLTIDDHGSSFVPTLKTLPDGVELHLTGEAEADSLLRAIAGAIAIR